MIFLNKYTVTSRLLDATKDIWSRYHSHPFVLGLSDGTLDREKFKHYMIQDYIYLVDYAKVFALGAAKAQTIDDMRVFAGYLHQILDGEMEIHRSYMKRLGITPEEAENALPSPETAYYTSYMLRMAYEFGAAEIAAAILSCALSYEVISKEIVKNNPDALNHPFYGEWVEGYSNDEYAKANVVLCELLERLAKDYSEDELARLAEIFIICSRCEEHFWDMAWEMRK